VSCLAELHIAVRRTNRYGFDAASGVVEHWLQNEEAIPGSLMYGRVLSSLGQHRAFQGKSAEARRYFDRALAVFGRLSDQDTMLREQRQTAAYRALASLDDATLTAADRRPLMEAAGVGLDPAQIRELAAMGDGESRWRHHLLVRYLAERCKDHAAIDAYLDAYEHWKDGLSHPWGLIAAWRGMLLLRDHSRNAAKWYFQLGSNLYSGPTARGVSGLIRHAIRQAAYCAGVDGQPAVPAEIASLRTLLPAASRYIDALQHARPGDDPVDVLRRVLPFNVR